MPVPTVATYSATALNEASLAFLALLDASTGPAILKIRSAAGDPLADLVLTKPAGTVNGTTGQLTLTTAAPVGNASNNGTAAYAELCNGDGVPHLSLPAVQGFAAVPGYVAINTLTFFSGAPVTVQSIVVG